MRKRRKLCNGPSKLSPLSHHYFGRAPPPLLPSTPFLPPNLARILRAIRCRVKLFGGSNLFYILYSGYLYVKRVWSNVRFNCSVEWNWSKVKVDRMLEKVFQAFEDRSIIEDDIKWGLSRTNVHACCNDFTLRWRRVFNKVDWKILSVCRFGYVSSGMI